MKNLATALVKAQKAFGPALKTSTNPHFKSRYADLAACVEAVIDALNDNGIALIQKNYDCTNGVMIETMFIHESGEMLECGILHVPANKQDAQGYGSALTYARRYSLMAACGIAPEDDDGNTAVRKPTIDETALIDHLAAIEASTDQEQLKAAYKAAYAACNGNADWQKKVIAAKDKVKAKL
jgi:phage tail protein X